jgi:dihydroflavonol-4-reductase
VRAVVTGASGHLGGNLVRALLDAGSSVRAVDVRRGPGLEGLDVEFMTGDVLDGESLRRAFAGADVVYHLAARISVAGDPDGTVWRVNVDGARHAAEAALACGVRRFVHCSSLHAYDVEAAGGPVDEGGPRSARPALPVYDRSKAAGEEEVRRVTGRGLDAVIVNPSGVVGPVDVEPSRLGRVLLAMFRGRMPAVVAGAFDWVDVRDVASALMAAAANGRTGENYLVSGHRATVGELAGMAASGAGRRAPAVTAPMSVARVAATVAVRVAGRRRAGGLLLTPEALLPLASDPVVVGAKAGRELGHRPRPLADTVRDLHASFRSQGRLGG